MPHLPTSAGRLFYHTMGDGPALLLWHSWLGDSGIWEAQAQMLSERYRVIVVDGPCHGRSEIRRFTLEECGDAIIEILDAEGIESAVLAGLSWGGMSVMRAALRWPHRVRGLALLGTTAEAESTVNVVACRFFANAVQRAGFRRPILDATLFLMFGNTTLQKRRHVVKREVKRLRQLDPRGIHWSTRAIVSHRKAIVHHLDAVRVPTVVIVGAEDRCLPPTRSRKIVRAIPGARLHVIEQAGHLVTVEAPEETTRLLLRFADEVHEDTGVTAA